jgi:high affinity Mn2+ porin
MRFFCALSILTFSLKSTFGQVANDSLQSKSFNLHFQTTYIYQYKPAFNSPYSGLNSLKGTEETENSLTSTLFLGIRLWKNCEVYINPEIAGGSGLSGAFGLAASTNGETYRVGDPAPTLYLARGYIRQTIGLSTEKRNEDDGANQVGCLMPKKYIQFLIGNFSLADVLDNNLYSNSPRTQFMNWTIMNNGAWDYAANVRGYTYSFTTIVQSENIAYKLSVATLPLVANGADLNTNLGNAYSLNAEVDKAYEIHEKSGNIRILGYYNNANMGSYEQAIANSDNEHIPDVISTRKISRDKFGFGISADQQINNVIGLFGRIGWNNGASETWCYTEADRTILGGIMINGKGWKRKDDNLGMAVVVNGLSTDHRNYLADGGLGFEIGDGKLNYGYENATELYYSYKPVSYPIWISGDYQFIVNPGYNKDRGPVHVFSIRIHVEL